MFAATLLALALGGSEQVDAFKAALAAPDAIEILSLGREDAAVDWKSWCQGHCFYENAVLGAAVVSAEERKTIASDVTNWIDQPPPEVVPMCFNPRHGVRVRKGDDMWDVVVCFECAQFEVFHGAAEMPLIMQRGFEGEQRPWDAILTAHGLTLAPTNPKGGE